MATLTVPTRSTPLPPPVRWTCDQFHSACDAGVFACQNVILIDGEILEMPPPNPPHNSGLELLCIALRAAFGTGFWVRNQMALDLALDVDPVPDAAVVLGSPRTVLTQPTTAALVCEVSDTTLPIDLGVKVHLYAAGGLAEYWVLDLNNAQLHVFRDPIPDATAPRGHRYRTTQILTRTQSVSPLAKPDVSVSVAELLP